MKTLSLLLLSFFVFVGNAFAGDIVVIVNKQNEHKITKELIAMYYLGEAKQWTGGTPISLIDLPSSNPERAAFCKTFLGVDIHEVKTIVAQNIMSGKSNAPREVASDEEVKKAVSDSRLAVGYIKASSVDDSIRVALTQ